MVCECVHYTLTTRYFSFSCFCFVFACFFTFFCFGLCAFLVVCLPKLLSILVLFLFVRPFKRTTVQQYYNMNSTGGWETQMRHIQQLQLAAASATLTYSFVHFLSSFLRDGRSFPLFAVACSSNRPMHDLRLLLMLWYMIYHYTGCSGLYIIEGHSFWGQIGVFVH